MKNWLRSPKPNKKPPSKGDGRREAGYFALQDPYGSALDDFDKKFDWDAKPDKGGHSAEASRKWWKFWQRDGLEEEDDYHPSTDEWEGDRRFDGDDFEGEEAPSEPPPKKSRKWRWFSRAIAGMLLVFFLIIGWLLVTAPLSKSLEPIAPPQITLLAADGTPIARSGASVDAPVEVAKLPDHVIEPFLAIEDRRFYSHWGIDTRGLARAAWSNATGGPTQGGSTITQQLAKFTFLSPEQTLSRKAREMLIAFWLEAWLTKDEILERYLSNAYFGDNQYGLRAASLHYFYRQPENLLPEQAAMLAGLLKAPSRYAPSKNYEAAEDRMAVVVSSMVAAGYLTQAEADAMRTPSLDVRTVNDLPTGTYFADWALGIARKDAEFTYAKETLTTTLDSRLQRIARRVVGRAGLGDAQVAMVAMRPSGEVVAMVGGKDYAASPFNRAVQAKRQPGSTFKLFTFLAALEAGAEPEDEIDNSEIVEGAYRPRNAGGRYSDAITLERAFASSSNVATVRLFNQIGSERVIEMARAMGITSPMEAGDPSLALGTSSVSLLELTSAYAGVAANEFPVEPRAFEEEEQGWFEWLFDGEESLSGGVHEDIEQMMRAAINSGTGKAAMLSIPNYGKTGTTQNNRDALFIGYAGDLVVGVWVGNDDNSPLDGVTGGGLPARIWRDFMKAALNSGALPKPQPQSDDTPNPEGPVQPLDVRELDEIPLGEGVQVEGEALVIETDIEGVPVDIRLNEDGLDIAPRDE